MDKTSLEGQGIFRFKLKGLRWPGAAEPLALEPEQTKRLRADSEYSGSTIEVLGVPFGGPIEGRDADGEAFTEGTDVWLRAGDSIPLTYLHGFGPDDPQSWQDPPVVIGTATYMGVGEVDGHAGHVFEGHLDADEELGLRVIQALEEGKNVRASSGAVAHLVRMGKAGIINTWPVGELAVFDTDDWKQPANDFAVVRGKAMELEPESAVEVGVSPTEAVLEPEPELQKTTSVKFSPMKGEIMDGENDEGVSLEKIVEAAVAAAQQVVKQAMADQAPVVKSKQFNMKHYTHLGFKDEPKAAFHWYLKTGDVEPYAAVTSDNPKVKAALQEAAGEGLELVPDDFYPGIIEQRDAASILRRAGAFVFNTNSRILDIPVEATALTKFGIVAEEGAIAGAEEEPVFATEAVTVYNFKKLIKVSNELLADDQTDNLEAYLNRALGRAWAGTENYYGIIGSGVGQPEGAVTGGTLGKTAAAVAAITFAEVNDLKYALAGEYREGAVWVMKGANEGYLRGLTGNPPYFWSMPLATGGVAMEAMLSHPVFNAPDMAAMAASAKTMLFGNFQFYGLVERQTLQIIRLRELYAGNGQVGILANVRMGGAVLQAEAFQYLAQAAA